MDPQPARRGGTTAATLVTAAFAAANATLVGADGVGDADAALGGDAGGVAGVEAADTSGGAATTAIVTAVACCPLYCCLLCSGAAWAVRSSRLPPSPPASFLPTGLAAGRRPLWHALLWSRPETGKGEDEIFMGAKYKCYDSCE